MPSLNKNSATAFLGLFLIFSLANLVALITPFTEDNYLTKPFLMIWLGWYAYAKLNPLTCVTAKWLILGIGFSFLGDTFLLFADGRPSGELFFLLGLGSFLLTHMAYWLTFHYWPDQQTGLLSRRPLLVFPFVVYWSLMIYLLWPLPAGMEIPVLIYSMVIMLMAIKALHIGPNLRPGDQLMLLVGVVLFVLSDSMIAFSRFTDYLPFNSIVTGWAIMLTYLSGQLLIVMAVTRSLNFR